MKRGLILDGGGMRGMFTCGLLDVMMENGLTVDALVGVSAGAAFGCNLKSHQPGRALRYNERCAHDRRYAGLWSLLTTGDYYNARFCYHTVPTEYDPFDFNAFHANPMEFYVTCTDVDTGQAVYHLCTPHDDAHRTLEWIRASASMPVVAQPVVIDGQRLLDGGMSDSIPLRWMQSKGCDRNVVVLTREAGYTKTPERLLPLIKWWMRRYPAVVQAMDNRAQFYNEQVAYVRQQEQLGNTLVFAPAVPLDVSRTTHSVDDMRRVYQQRRRQALERLDELKSFLSQNG